MIHTINKIQTINNHFMNERVIPSHEGAAAL